MPHPHPQSTFENLRKDFPILQRTVRDNKRLVYLDNASTTQKPNQVIDSISDYYRNYNSNIHRAVYALAEEATEAYEKTRDKIANFINVLWYIFIKIFNSSIRYF